ncbi:hypothetical protein BC351_33350 [Paenibacillus ferrarius]|uniref:Uncharacterized protein n=1 Tax=Paenibacillus ferrarius TaxID=1469647 RepID=A0A1V4HDU9_9BACL|nr:hypothetical protein BC351_33350 [Paenibacillus ferrarius]
MGARCCADDMAAAVKPGNRRWLPRVRCGIEKLDNRKWLFRVRCATEKLDNRKWLFRVRCATEKLGNRRWLPKVRRATEKACNCAIVHLFQPRIPLIRYMPAKVQAFWQQIEFYEGKAEKACRIAGISYFQVILQKKPAETQAFPIFK